MLTVNAPAFDFSCGIPRAFFGTRNRIFQQKLFLSKIKQTIF